MAQDVNKDSCGNFEIYNLEILSNIQMEVKNMGHLLELVAGTLTVGGDAGAFWCTSIHIHWYMLVHIGAYWCILVHTGAFWCTSVHIQWCMLVHIGACRCILVHTSSLVHSISLFLLQFTSMHQQLITTNSIPETTGD